MTSIQRIQHMSAELAAEIRVLEDACFPGCDREDPYQGVWWLARAGSRVVGYAAALIDPGPSKWPDRWMYITRMGVLDEARGQGLQRRLGRAQIAHAKRRACPGVHTYTVLFNTVSANNLIALGFRRWQPAAPWVGAVDYWRMPL